MSEMDMLHFEGQTSANDLCRQFEVQARRIPDAVAVVYEDRSVTYRQLNERANLLAHHLIDLGAGSGSLVPLCVERSLDMIVAILGILKAGGAYVPIDPADPRKRLSFILEDTDARLFL